MDLHYPASTFAYTDSCGCAGACELQVCGKMPGPICQALRVTTPLHTPNWLPPLRLPITDFLSPLPLPNTHFLRPLALLCYSRPDLQLEPRR